MTVEEIDPPAIKTAAVLLMNDRGEIPLVLRDDGPAFCVFGGVAEGEESFEECALRELAEETNLEMADWPKLEFLYALDGIYADNGNACEQCHVFQLSIGDYPLKLGNEGIKIGFFPLDDIPVNMKSWQGQLIQEALKGPRPETRDAPVPFVYQSQFQEYATHHRSNFKCLDEWRTNAAVMRRKAEGSLKYDPDAAASIVTSLLKHHSKNGSI